MSPGPMVHWQKTPEPTCFLAMYGVYIGPPESPMPPCDGALVRCHLLPKQRIKQKYPAHGKPKRAVSLRAEAYIKDRRSWVWGCGGPMGNAGHHGMLDHSRTLKIPRLYIPAGTEQLAEELEMVWWLDIEYGPRVSSDDLRDEVDGQAFSQ